MKQHLTIKVTNHLVWHQRCNRSSHFVVSLLIADWSELNENEACWDRNFSEIGYQHSFLQAYESNERLWQALHFTYQNVWCLSTGRNLLQEVFIILQIHSVAMFTTNHVSKEGDKISHVCPSNIWTAWHLTLIFWHMHGSWPMDHSRWRKLIKDVWWSGWCEWVNVSSGTGLPG